MNLLRAGWFVGALVTCAIPASAHPAHWYRLNFIAGWPITAKCALSHTTPFAMITLWQRSPNYQGARVFRNASGAVSAVLIGVADNSGESISMSAFFPTMTNCTQAKAHLEGRILHPNDLK